LSRCKSFRIIIECVRQTRLRKVEHEALEGITLQQIAG
jgi:hypothetical protein